MNRLSANYAGRKVLPGCQRRLGAEKSERRTFAFSFKNRTLQPSPLVAAALFLLIAALSLAPQALARGCYCQSERKRLEILSSLAPALVAAGEDPSFCGAIGRANRRFVALPLCG